MFVILEELRNLIREDESLYYEEHDSKQLQKKYAELEQQYIPYLNNAPKQNTNYRCAQTLLADEMRFLETPQGAHHTMYVRPYEKRMQPDPFLIYHAGDFDEFFERQTRTQSTLEHLLIPPINNQSQRHRLLFTTTRINNQHRLTQRKILFFDYHKHNPSYNTMKQPHLLAEDAYIDQLKTLLGEHVDNKTFLKNVIDYTKQQPFYDLS